MPASGYLGSFHADHIIARQHGGESGLQKFERRRVASSFSEKGRYRIPGDNPFVSKTGARGEIRAYGLRNPERLTWDFDPRNPRDNHLIASVIGLYTWETVVVVKKGANYGYSLREGNQKLDAANHLSDLSGDDRIPVRINATETDGTVTPTFPCFNTDTSRAAVTPSQAAMSIAARPSRP